MKELSQIKISKVFDIKLDTDFIKLEIKNLQTDKGFVGYEDSYKEEEINEICKNLGLDKLSTKKVYDRLAEAKLIEFDYAY